MQRKGGRLKAIFISLAVLAIGQVFWWAYLLISQRGEIASTGGPLATSQLHHFTVMILSESGFFITVWALAMWSAFRFTREQAGLRQAHTDFFSAITHELKTPLANIQLSLDTLERPNLNEEMRKKYLERGQIAVARLLKEIEAILILTNSDRHAHEAQNISLNELVEQSVRAVQGTHTTHASLKIKIDPAHIVCVAPEEARLIVQSLIDNAFKYHQPEQAPSIQISSHLLNTARSGNASRIELRVQDAGVGLNSDEVQRVFAPFWRSARSTIDAKPGTGLGLALALSLARRTKLELKLESPGLSKGTIARVVFSGAQGISRGGS